MPLSNPTDKPHTKGEHSRCLRCGPKGTCPICHRRTLHRIYADGEWACEFMCIQPGNSRTVEPLSNKWGRVKVAGGYLTHAG